MHAHSRGSFSRITMAHICDTDIGQDYKDMYGNAGNASTCNESRGKKSITHTHE